MAPVANKRYRGDDETRRPKKKIKIKKQTAYHSSSEDEDEPMVTSDAPLPKALEERKKPKSILKQTAPTSSREDVEVDPEDEEDVDDELAKNTALNTVPEDSDEEDEVMQDDDEAASSGSEDEDASSEHESEASITSSNLSQASRKKRNDPTAFATSISAILSTKLSNAKRTDPVLSRSKSASEANKSISDAKLSAQAQRQVRAEKKAALEKGRVRDVLGLETPEVETGMLLEEEKRLKKTAQRGVVRLFNAVRAAQVSAEEGSRKAREEGMVGIDQREERVREMSKKGFLDLISSGGKAAAAEA